MNKINFPDYKTLLTSSVTSLFESMFSMKVIIVDPDSKADGDSDQIIGLSDFSGEITGCLNFQTSKTFSRLMTASMLGLEVEEIGDENEVLDVIKEVMNILGGNIKSDLAASSIACEFSKPSILTDSEFKSIAGNYTKIEQLSFNCQEHTILVEMYEKSESADSITAPEEIAISIDQLEITEDSQDKSEITEDSQDKSYKKESEKLKSDKEQAEKEQAEIVIDINKDKDDKNNDGLKDPEITRKQSPPKDDSDKEIIDKKKKIKSCVIVIGSTILVIICFLGLFKYYKKQEKSNQIASLGETDVISKIFSEKQLKTDLHVTTDPSTQPEQISRIDGKLNEAANLRDRLLIKYQEIIELKKHSENGIEEIKNEIIEELQRKKITSFKQAIKNTKIELDLLTIQHRLAYLQALDKPLQSLDLASEELLYIKRLTQIDMQMIQMFSGFDEDMLLERIDSTINKHISKTGKLSIQIEKDNRKSLIKIWEHIITGLKEKENQNSSYLPEARKNHEISKEICAGNFNRKYELTSLSPETASCLSKWTGKDLYLSDIKSLSPDSAKNLAKWQGKWLALNGLKYLSPETAKNLVKWRGKRLSLNGLKKLEPEVVRILAKWQGEQLELIGLSHMIDLKKSGGKFFLSEKLRKVN